MTLEIIAVLAILGLSVLLFITEWVRMDLVALLVLGGLALTGLVSPSEALSGFSSPAVVTVWAVLILSAGLARTGVAGRLGHLVLRVAGDSEVRLLMVIMLTAGVLSGFMNSIGVASLLLPVVIDIARRTDRPPSRLLMPLAFACLMGGLNTLIGTPPNILISEALRDAGLRPFQMFDYTPVGLVVLLTGTAFMILVGRHLLPDRDIVKELSQKERDIKDLYRLKERMSFLSVPAGSALDGKTLGEARLGAALGLNVVAVFSDGRTRLAPEADYRLRAGDRLLVEGRLERLDKLSGQNHLDIEGSKPPLTQLVSGQIELAELKVRSGSKLSGRTVREIGFRQQYHALVLALRRGEKIVRTNLENLPLEEGDILLVQGRKTGLDDLRDEADVSISPAEELESYQLTERLMTVRLAEDSAWVGKTLAESRLGELFKLRVLGVFREKYAQLIPSPEEELQAGDVLLVEGKEEDLLTLEGFRDLEIESAADLDLDTLETEQTGLLEVVLSPRSSLAGRALRELDFRTKYGLNVLAVWREGQVYRSNLQDMRMRFGDALLVFGSRRRLRLLAREPDFITLSEEVQEAPRLEKAPLAVAIMALVLASVIAGWTPIAIAAVVGAVLMVLSGCLTMEEAYRSIEWKAVFLIAGMLPLGIAMEGTGTARFLGEGVVSLIGGFGPRALLAGLFTLSALASQVMPNPAVAVLLAPIALNAAANLGVSPHPLMMGVALSASAAFLSPVGHPANMLVMGPGGYRFSDYARVGLPLTMVTLIVVILVLPLFWAF
ncbi:MAG: SLC13 family permease [Anaerolineales bacterium]